MVKRLIRAKRSTTPKITLAMVTPTKSPLNLITLAGLRVEDWAGDPKIIAHKNGEAITIEIMAPIPGMTLD